MLEPGKRALALAAAFALLLCAANVAFAQIAWRATSTMTMRSATLAAPTFQAAGTAAGGAGSVSPTWPAHAINDVALLFCESAGGEPVTLSTPSGFVAVTNSPQATGAGTAGTQISVFWARATSTAMAAPTVADAGDHVYCQILTYRGVTASGDPWEVTAGGVKAGASTSVTVTGVTTAINNALIVQAVARDTDSAAAAFSGQTNANLTGIAERSDGGSAAGGGGGLGIWDGVMASPGATGNTTATVGSSINAFITIALTPGEPTPYFQGAGTGVGGTGSVSPTWPTHAVDDIGLLFCESAGGEPATLSVANGFAAVANSPQATGAGTAGTQLTVFWARATSSTMAAPTVADPGNHVYCVILVYRGVIPSGNPFDVTSGGVKGTASTSVTVTGVTTTVNNALVVQAVARDNDSAAAAFSAQTNANLSGLLERSDAGDNAGNGGGIGIWDGVMRTAGATGNTTATVTSSINAFMTIALRPAAVRLGVPTGTLQGDLMIAAITVTPAGATIQAPAGWTGETATVGTTTRQQIFHRFADAGDAAGGVSYVWSFANSSTGAAGAIVSYSGVDTRSTSPIQVFSGNTTPQGGDPNTSHRAVSVTTIPNSMVISTHGFSSSESWTSPTGMQSRVNISSETAPNAAGVSLSFNELAQASAGATGDKVATVAGNGDSGVAHLLALRPALNHYAISSLIAETVPNCHYAEITVTGHGSATDHTFVVAPAATRTVTLSVSPASATAEWQATLVSGTGAWTPSGQTATYVWPAGQNETSFTVRLRQSAVTTHSVNLTDTFSTTEGTGTDDPPFSFVNSAFRISDGSNAALSIGTQISAKPSSTAPGIQTLHLQAVRTDTQTGACTTVFPNNTDVAIEVGAECMNPSSCSQNVTLTTNTPATGNFVPGAAGTYPATINFRFSATGTAEAPFNFSYADAGQIRLQFKHTFTSPAPTTTITGTSNAFVVRPFGFRVTGPTTAASPSESSTAFKKAGENFDVTVTAVQWKTGDDSVVDGIPDSEAEIASNTATPNFGLESTPATAELSRTLNTPSLGAGGNQGTLGGSFTFSGFTGGTKTQSVNWSEVGFIDLKALTTNYLGGGQNVSNSAAGLTGVGRFYPDHFTVTAAGALTPGCSPGGLLLEHTYLGQSFPIAGVTVQARNASNGLTSNYHNFGAGLNFAKHNPADKPTWGFAARDTTLGTILAVDTGAMSVSGTWTNGVLAAGFTNLAITRPAAASGPFANMKIGIALAEGAGFDGVAMLSGDFDVDLALPAGNDHKQIGSTQLFRFGRLRMQNSLSSGPMVALPVPIETQYWNSGVSAFVRNGDDNCTTLARENFGFSDPRLNLAVCDTSVFQATVSFAGGTGTMRLNPPGSGKNGSLLLTANVGAAASLGNKCPDNNAATAANKAYLQGAWTGATFTEDPSARASWGIFGGQPNNFIFQRENF